MALSAFLASPLDISARNSSASSSIAALSLPMPFFSSYTARFIIVLISSFSSGFNSNIIDLDIKAPFTSKYGFSVVAPIRIIVPSSTNGSR